MTGSFDPPAFDPAAFDPAAAYPAAFGPAQPEAAAQRMQQQLIRAQETISAAELTGTTADSLVTVTGNGIGDVTGLVISPALARDDVEALAEAVLAALADLGNQRRAFAEQVMSPFAEPPAGEDGSDLSEGDLPRTADGLIDLG